MAGGGVGVGGAGAGTNGSTVRFESEAGSSASVSRGGSGVGNSAPSIENVATIGVSTTADSLAEPQPLATRIAIKAIETAAILLARRTENDTSLQSAPRVPN